MPDTLGHRLPVCLTTAEAVTRRHNAVMNQMAIQLRRKNFEIWVERRIVTPRGEWRPDLIVKVPCHKSRSGLTKGWVLDPTIVSDGCEDMNAELVRNQDKYDVADVVEEVKELTNAQLDISVVGVVWNWRGIMAPSG